MIFRKRTAVILAAVLVVAVLSAVLFKTRGYISTDSGVGASERQVIIIDAGHEALENTINW